MFVLFCNAVYILLALFASPLAGLFTVGALLPSIGAGIRRMHDTNRSGWWLIVPIANLIFACERGTTGPNQYGPDPLQTQECMP